MGSEEAAAKSYGDQGGEGEASGKREAEQSPEKRAL